ncbi:hypothetical protein QBC39DRAFT_112073 [Podospora conica]|nr:hypothetical protein QBC39DRAFT_112073 [Schizothecium conicum]
MASSTSSGHPPLQPGRKRRAHKRSRNGCSTCKQRHIRCDEVKPICTTCLTRGGECGYPEQSRSATPSASTVDSGTGSALRGTLSSPESIYSRPSSPANPFNSFPITLPHRALDRFNHFTTQNISSPTSVPKETNPECASLLLSNPGTFRASLLSTALSYSWLPAGQRNSDMEEALLSHKLEAMRVVNAQIADPVLRTSDGCLSLIAALALVESGMGNYAAAEAHLKGLFTLIDIKTPQNWQHRLYGLLQRAIAVTGSFIAAAKRMDGVEVLRQVAEYELNNYEQQIHITQIPSSPVPATNLSPFYFGLGSPTIPACKLDIEGLILINALRQLSSMPVLDADRGTHRTRGGSLAPRSRSGTPLGAVIDNPIGSYELAPDGTAVLLADTDAYTVSLLFKPHPMHRNPQQGSASPTKSNSPFPSRTPPPRPDTTPIPSATRAWATAAYLYLHIVLSPVWEETEPTPSHTPPPSVQQYHQQLARQQHQQQLRHQSSSPASSPRRGSVGRVPRRIIGGIPIDEDPHLLRVLLDTLRADIRHTEGDMRNGSYSRDFWLWKVVVGGYCVEMLGRGGSGSGSGAGGRTREASPPNEAEAGEGLGGGGKKSWWGWVLEEDEEDDEGGSEGEDAEGEMEGEEDVGAWFGERLRAWSDVTRITSWEGARRAVERIVWPASEGFAGEVVAEGVWWRAVGGPTG